VIHVRSFSKSHAMAGFRIGYAIAEPDLSPVLGVGAPALAGALWAVENGAASASRRRSQAAEERERLVCANGHIAYVNPRLVVSTFPVTDEGHVLLIRRGFEPGRGLWAQPGGFLEVDETPSEGAIRETREETGLHVALGEIVGLYARLEAAVIVLAYEARIVGGEATTGPEATEIVAFPPESLPWPEIAFRTTYWALVDWLARRRPELRPSGPPPGR
jgi:ADP-ribose pyrophosphatase YjhB (NUDIX family)